MTDRPIIFSAPMVRALLEGRKTMTRRLAHVERLVKATVANPEYWGGFPSPWTKVQVGDRLWVRENWRADDFAADDPSRTIFMADADPDALRETRGIIKWRPCIHMPRARSRLTLIVTATKVERLQEMSEADAIDEGVLSLDPSVSAAPHEESGRPALGPSPVRRFEMLWNSLHGEAVWDQNPEVVAMTFRVVKANIDAAPGRPPWIGRQDEAWS